MRALVVSVLLVPALLVPALLAAACGGVADTTSGPSDASTADAAGPDTSAVAPEPPDSGLVFTPSPSSCDGGPDGGACDRSRLRVVHRGAVGCFAVGQFCDVLMVSIDAADQSKLPQGFTCSFDLGVATCSWPLVNHGIDQAALDAACAVTVALPAANVDCIIYD
jgi:hypothetical protein